MRQFNGGPHFALIRFEATGSAFWFKAVGEPNTREFPLTLILAKNSSSYMPQVVATLPGCHGWLAAEAPGSSLETGNTVSWAAAAAALAELQIESITYTKALESAGARKLSYSLLHESLKSVLEQIRRAMVCQEKSTPPRMNSDELNTLEEQLSIALSQSIPLAIPETVGNLDLNPANVFVSPHKCTYLDWAEAYVGNPFFSFEYFLEQSRRVPGASPGGEQGLTTAYWDRWRTVLSAADIATARHLSPLLAVLAYAVASGSDQQATGRNSRQATYLRSLARRMKREMDVLADWGVVCHP
jgi:hypothetical protein